MKRRAGFPEKIENFLGARACARSAGDPGAIPGSGRSPEKETATHSSILAWEIPERGVWWTTVHEVAKELDTVTKQQESPK